jgi:hypothetical protein
VKRTLRIAMVCVSRAERISILRCLERPGAGQQITITLASKYGEGGTLCERPSGIDP